MKAVGKSIRIRAKSDNLMVNSSNIIVVTGLFLTVSRFFADAITFIGSLDERPSIRSGFSLFVKNDSKQIALGIPNYSPDEVNTRLFSDNHRFFLENRSHFVYVFCLFVYNSERMFAFMFAGDC
jgi:hypothetical protein